MLESFGADPSNVLESLVIFFGCVKITVTMLSQIFSIVQNRFWIFSLVPDKLSLPEKFANSTEHVIFYFLQLKQNIFHFSRTFALK